MRRVTFKLEDDHPIFNYPAGERSRKIRELLQLAEMGELLKRIEAKLDQILAGQVILKEPPQPAVDPHEERMSKIAASLVDALEEFERNLDKEGF